MRVPYVSLRVRHAELVNIDPVVALMTTREIEMGMVQGCRGRADKRSASSGPAQSIRFDRPIIECRRYWQTWMAEAVRQNKL